MCMLSFMVISLKVVQIFPLNTTKVNITNIATDIEHWQTKAQQKPFQHYAHSGHTQKYVVKYKVNTHSHGIIDCFIANIMNT